VWEKRRCFVMVLRGMEGCGRARRAVMRIVVEVVAIVVSWGLM